MDSDGFILVKHSKKNKKKCSIVYSCDEILNSTAKNNIDNEPTNNLAIASIAKDYCDHLKILEKEFIQSQFFVRFCEVLKEHNLNISTVNSESKYEQSPTCQFITKIICLGLGNFSFSKQSQYQLIFLR